MSGVKVSGVKVPGVKVCGAIGTGKWWKCALIVLWVVIGAAACDAAAPASAQGTPAHSQSQETTSPHAGLYIDSLRSRAYGGGDLRIVRTLGVTGAFTRSLITYTSDGLVLQGFMNVPRGQGPFPVVIVVHGYVTPSRWRTLGYTARYADDLARNGFLVLHPDLRGHGVSQGEGTEPLFRVGYAVDVLNLAQLARRIPQADAGRIGLFGHSMGGGISIRAIAIDAAATDPAIKAAVLYGSMNADENLNTERIANVFRRTRDLPELSVPQEDVVRISPSNYLGELQAAVSIHHGSRDDQVPPEWSADLQARLTELGKDAEHFRYPGAGHSFYGSDYRTFMRRAVAFFEARLR